jgi:nucleotide-binding universal stress UspA family protein
MLAAAGTPRTTGSYSCPIENAPTQEGTMNDLKQILVGVDFSPPSAAALRQAMRIGKWSQASLKVVHVLETLLVVDIQEAMSVLQEDIVNMLMADAKEGWQAFAAKIPGAASLPFEVEINSAVAGLTRRAGEPGVGLLVLGAHGSQDKKAVGPVATGCVRRSPSDVLLVQEPHDRAYTTVIACVDFSPTSRRAVEQAAAVAARDSATLYVIHAYSAPWRKSALRKPATADLDVRYRDMMLARLEEFCKPMGAEMTYLKPRYQLVEHDSHAHGIGHFARQIGADLVVLGKRGKSNLRDVFLGSTAERVLRDAPCSILAVRPV